MSKAPIRVGLIPAAGKGDRIAELPLTRILPKPMLPLLNKPLAEYAIDNIKSIGINRILMVIGHKGDVIRSYFGNGSDFGVEIEYIENNQLELGLGHSVYLAKDRIDGPFMTILGDDLTVSRSLENFVDVFNDHALVVEGVVRESDAEALKRACCVSLDGNIITEIIEKPEVPRTDLRGCGVYVFSPEIFDMIKQTPPHRGGEVRITDTIALAAAQRRAYGTLIDGVNINVNTLEDMEIATSILLRKARGFI